MPHRIEEALLLARAMRCLLSKLDHNGHATVIPRRVVDDLPNVLRQWTEFFDSLEQARVIEHPNHPELVIVERLEPEG